MGTPLTKDNDGKIPLQMKESNCDPAVLTTNSSNTAKTRAPGTESLEPWLKRDHHK